MKRLLAVLMSVAANAGAMHKSVQELWPQEHSDITENAIFTAEQALERWNLEILQDVQKKDITSAARRSVPYFKLKFLYETMGLNNKPREFIAAADIPRLKVEDAKEEAVAAIKIWNENKDFLKQEVEFMKKAHPNTMEFRRKGLVGLLLLNEKIRERYEADTDCKQSMVYEDGFFSVPELAQAKEKYEAYIKYESDLLSYSSNH